jgi:hypothetical protein
MSPSREQLGTDTTIETMQALRDEGKVRFLGMSGTLPNLPEHIATGVCVCVCFRGLPDPLQVSVFWLHILKQPSIARRRWRPYPVAQSRLRSSARRAWP